MALIQSTAIPSGATDYELEQSLKFEDSKVAYLSRTPSSVGNRQVGTFSAWVKIGNLGKSRQEIFRSGTTYENATQVAFGANGIIWFNQTDSGNWTTSLKTNALYRDPSAWLHICIKWNTTNSTEANRVKIYVNGEQVTSLAESNYPSENANTHFSSTTLHTLGMGVNADANNNVDGYLAEIHYIDGTNLNPDNFGETGTYGEWKPIEYSGSYGTNGFYLPFKNDYTVEGFSTVTYKGNGGTQYIGGTGFSPSLTWIKERSSTSGHNLVDKIRGSSQRLMSQDTNAEDANGNITSFSADGFTLGSNAGSNENGQTNVAWNWDMGADTPTGFGCVTYKGNDSTQDISGFGFSPDLLWIKNRSAAEEGRILDQVRGVPNGLVPSTTDAEKTDETNGVTKYNPDGFSLGGADNINGNGNDIVAWGWDMGNTTATNTSGSINSQVRANTTYGQSIVNYTGTGSNATVGHGLSSAPEFMIVKTRSHVGDWMVYAGDNTDFLKLNETNATEDLATVWNDTSPTNSVFSLGSNGDVNTNGRTYVAYAFHSVSGYSKFGSYSGTGSANNAVTLGFRPAFLMVKNTGASENWAIIDSTRSPINSITKALKADATDAEQDNAVNTVNFTDTGFSIVSTDARWNASSNNYIYMAFAGGMDSISDYNTDGSIDSRVKANTTYGQSIVSYGGTNAANATVGHGLSSAPEMIIAKGREEAYDWQVYHKDLGGGTNPHTYRIKLNGTHAELGGQNIWGNAQPTSSVFTLGADAQINPTNGKGVIAYCFHSVTGYSSIGSYSGNSSTTGPTVTLGFRPAWLLIKSSTVADSWFIMDTTRSSNTTPLNTYLEANGSSDETSHANANINILDTGFQLKTAHEAFNTTGNTYIYMAFADKREYAYWLDQSGNNNDWTSNNLTESDISVDSPTNNFATWNAVYPPNSARSASFTLAEGNLQTTSVGNGSKFLPSTMNIPATGKWYMELYVKSITSGGNYANVGFSSFDKAQGTTGGDDFGDAGTHYYEFGLQDHNDSGRTLKSSGTTQVFGSNGDFVAGSIMNIAIDMDNKRVFIGKNGTYYLSANPSTPTADSTSTWYGWSSDADGQLMLGLHNDYETDVILGNFGQDSSFAGNKTAQGNQDGNDIGDFYYNPPTGYLALCTKNLPDVVVTPSEHFNTVLYTGNGSTQSITGVGFQPNWVWLKNRSVARNHEIYDAIRGATKGLMSNDTDAEATRSTGLTAFNSDGFSLGSHNNVNENTADFVSWNWKANGSGSSNSNGSITSTVSANADAGFSIVSYTGNATAGATVGHGLSKAPEMVITKNRSTGNSSWSTYVESLGNATKLLLDTADSVGSTSNYNSTSPTASLISFGSGNQVNSNGDNYITYCFHSVDGYSKVGSYTGNGNADGTFVYTGFRPAYVLRKPVDDSGWKVADNKRDGFNADSSNDLLVPNTSGAETDAGRIDLVSNGFKVRTSSGGENENGITFIYLAFAETPFKYSNAR